MDASFRCTARLALAAALAAGAAARAESPDAAAVRRQFGPDARLTLVGIQGSPAAKAGPATLTIQVRNASPETVHMPVATIHFLDRDGRTIATRPCLLGLDEIPPRVEDAYRVTLAEAPAFERVEAKLAWGESQIEQPGGRGDPQGRDLALDGYRLVRFNDGAVWAAGRLASRLAQAAGDVTVALLLQDKAGRDVKQLRTVFPNPMEPGDRQGFELWAGEAPTFEGYRFSLTYKTGKGGAAPAAAARPEAGLAVAERASRQDVAAVAAVVGPAAVTPAPPAPGAAGAKKPDKASTALQACIEGIEWIDGVSQMSSNLGQMLYSGDLGFLKVRFTGVDGGPAQPDATVILKLYDRGAGQGTVRRAISKATWKRDVTRLPGTVTKADVVAASPDGREAWVGLVRVPSKGAADLKVDVTVQIAGAGTWEWKGQVPPFRAGPEPPNKK